MFAESTRTCCGRAGRLSEQAAWEKLFKYMDIEPKLIQPSAGSFTVNPEHVRTAIDENTIGYEDFNNPRPGEMFLYMVEFKFADGTSSTYGTDTAAKPRYPASGACE